MSATIRNVLIVAGVLILAFIIWLVFGLGGGSNSEVAEAAEDPLAACTADPLGDECLRLGEPAEITETVTEVPAKTHREGCKKIIAKGVVDNVVGFDLYKAHLTKKFCYDDGRVVRHPSPGYGWDVTNVGQVTGWHFENTWGARHKYLRWHGRDRGSHTSERHAYFERSALGHQVGSDSIHLRIRGYGDGSFSGRASN